MNTLLMLGYTGFFMLLLISFFGMLTVGRRIIQNILTKCAIALAPIVLFCIIAGLWVLYLNGI